MGAAVFVGWHCLGLYLFHPKAGPAAGCRGGPDPQCLLGVGAPWKPLGPKCWRSLKDGRCGCPRAVFGE